MSEKTVNNELTLAQESAPETVNANDASAQASDSSSIYQAPSSDVERKELLEGSEPEPATHLLRFSNFIIDHIAFLVVVFLVGFIWAVAVPSGLPEEESTGFGLLRFFIMVPFYVFFEGLFSRTPGKMLTGTVVVNEKGERPSFGQIVGRSFARVIPFEAFSFLGSTGRGWHDSLSKTYVVKVNSLVD